MHNLDPTIAGVVIVTPVFLFNATPLTPDQIDELAWTKFIDDGVYIDISNICKNTFIIILIILSGTFKTENIIEMS